MYGRVSLARAIMDIYQLHGLASFVFTIGVAKFAHMLLLYYLKSKLVFALRSLLVHALTCHVFGTERLQKR